MRSENADKYEPLGVPNKITLHWTAGNYYQTYNHYHYCVQGDGRVVNTLPVKYKGSHTWKHNSNNIGISMCCMMDSKHPPTKIQIENTAKLIADICDLYNIHLDNVQDHRFYARLDGYESLRWDVGDYMPTLRKKAKWYLDRIKNGTDKNKLRGN